MSKNPVQRQDLHEGLLIAHKSKTLYRVSTIYDRYFTAAQVFPSPDSTVVKVFRFEPPHLRIAWPGWLAEFSEPSIALLRQYNEARSATSAS